VHETLYHFHKPKDEAEANLWLRRALVTFGNYETEDQRALVREVCAVVQTGLAGRRRGVGRLGQNAPADTH